MALKLYDKIIPSDDFALVHAEHVEMPDGSNLAEFANEAVTQVQGLGARVTDLENSDALPPVTTDDNGKVLQVIGGQWEPGAPLNSASATSVDLTDFESAGTIVETYADGSTITYTMEFDESGNPVKITDSNGNVTDLVGFSSMGGKTYEAAEGVSF